MIFWTVVKVWALINMLGIAIATAVGIYRDVTEDGSTDDA